MNQTTCSAALEKTLSPAKPVSTGLEASGVSLLGSMGLKGIWAQIANMTAVLLICLMFYQSQNAAIDSAREERVNFREELRLLHRDSARKADELHGLTESIKKLTEQVESKKP
jgi:septal ring factor EnvC (AmiA/AmiB activator)